MGKKAEHEFTIDVERSLIRRRWRGEVTARFVLNATSEIQAHPDFDGSFDILSDYREVELSITPAEARAVMDTVKGWHSGRIAMVANSDILYGMARLGQVHLDPDMSKVRVFRDEGEARSWLLEGRGGEREVGRAMDRKQHG